MQKHWTGRRSSWAVIALGASMLAGCTTYKPLDGGSQVPWAAQAQAARSQVAQSQVEQSQVGQRQAAAPAPRRQAVVASELPPLDARPGPVRLGPARPAVAVDPAPASAAPALAPVMATRPRAVKEPGPLAQPAPQPAKATVAAVQPDAPAAKATQHRVAAGDRLGAVAQAYGVSLAALAEANDLAPPYVIHVGQILRLPSGGEAAPVRYVVRQGDTLSDIARRFDVATADVAATNGIASPYQLSVGQSLAIPGVQTARAVPDAAPPPLTGRGFLWPVSGKVVGGYGVTASGQHRNGINIAARKGAPVVAAEDGIVVYASDGIDGYGRMVLVRHAEAYITTYAHNASLLVEVGDVVRRGQVIARVGDTGDVSSSQLHFELRRGTKPINPEAVLVRDSTAVASTS
jgi:murein DD-endopeptidase MepM/ murein hydrolase activator NlpD